MISHALRRRRDHVKYGSRHVGLIVRIIVALTALTALVLTAGRKFVLIYKVVHDNILLDVSLELGLGMQLGVDIVVLGHIDVMAYKWGRPRFSAIGIVSTVEDVVKRKFYGGSCNTEPVRRGGPNAFSVVHAIRNRRCWIEENRRIEISGKQRWKKQGSGSVVEGRVVANNRRRLGLFSVADGKVRVYVVVFPAIYDGFDLIVYTRRTGGGPYSLVRISFELGRRFQIWFCSGSAPGSRNRSIDAESELHSFDRAGLRILTGFAIAFFLGRSLS